MSYSLFHWTDAANAWIYFLLIIFHWTKKFYTWMPLLVWLSDPLLASDRAEVVITRPKMSLSEVSRSQLPERWKAFRFVRLVVFVCQCNVCFRGFWFKSNRRFLAFRELYLFPKILCLCKKIEGKDWHYFVDLAGLPLHAVWCDIPEVMTLGSVG